MILAQVLGVLFLFVFSGIEALAGASTLGTVVNSLLPLVAGRATKGLHLLADVDLGDLLDKVTIDIDAVLSPLETSSFSHRAMAIFAILKRG